MERAVVLYQPLVTYWQFLPSIGHGGCGQSRPYACAGTSIQIEITGAPPQVLLATWSGWQAISGKHVPETIHYSRTIL